MLSKLQTSKAYQHSSGVIVTIYTGLLEMNNFEVLAGQYLTNPEPISCNHVQCVPKKGYPLKSSASVACSNLNALTP